MTPLGALDYHRLTRHLPDHLGARDDPRLLPRFQPMDMAVRPPPFKAYPGLRAEPVPKDLDQVLFLAAGVVRVMEHRRMGRLWFRAAGSAGNLCPVEVYVVAGGRVVHYEPLEHAVTPVGPARAGPTTVVLTGVPWRTAWKYGERGFRHLYWDAGTMASHLLAATGASARLHLGFVDAEVAALVGADGVQEFPLAVVVLGDGPPPLTPPPGRGAQAGFLGAPLVEFPVVTAAQRAGDLHSAAAVDDWVAAPAGAPAPADVTFRRSLGEVVRRRGSTREFDPREPASNAALVAALGAATSSLNADFTPPGGTLLDHHVLVHTVMGVTPGPYRWDPATQGVLPVEGPAMDTRRLGQLLALDQPLGGTGAYTAFHGADLEAVTARLGDRGYRCAQFEAGVVEGRLHLSAFALGFGATGLTFFDDEVRRAFRTSSWPMLVTAVGRPAYRSRPGGEPGRPTPLSSF